MSIITRTFNKLGDIGSFITIAQAHGGRLLCDQTMIKTASGIFDGRQYVSISVEIPDDNYQSFEAIVSVTMKEDDIFD